MSLKIALYNSTNEQSDCAPKSDDCNQIYLPEQIEREKKQAKIKEKVCLLNAYWCEEAEEEEEDEEEEEEEEEGA